MGYGNVGSVLYGGVRMGFVSRRLDHTAERTFWVPPRVPGAPFEPLRSSRAGDAAVLVSRDGAAKLLVGAFANDARHTPASYQAYLTRRSYASFPVSYAPRGRTWFSLSGEGGGKTFYEKVMFSCGNEVITSFAMIYPTAQRRRFDAVVERIENSFQPGPGCK